MAIRDYHGNKKWVYGVVATKTGPASYRLDIAQCVFWRRHIDQICATEVTEDRHISVARSWSNDRRSVRHSGTYRQVGNASEVVNASSGVINLSSEMAVSH